MPNEDKEVLRTERLRLREFTPDDAGCVLELVNDPDWHRYINNPGVHTHAQALDWMEQRLFGAYRRFGHGLWAVERLVAGEPDGTVLGMCGLLKRDSLPDVDLGYGFLPAHRGQGYAQEAAAACLQHGRQALGFKRILAMTSLDNEISRRLLLSLGMAEIGVERLDPQGEVRLFEWLG